LIDVILIHIIPGIKINLLNCGTHDKSKMPPFDPKVEIGDMHVNCKCAGQSPFFKTFLDRKKKKESILKKEVLLP